MAIIRVIDNENDRSKTNAQKEKKITNKQTKTEKNKGGTEAKVKE